MGLTDMKTLTVVITSGDERAADVRRTAARWAGEGLLQESIWLTVDDAAIPTSGAPEVSARLLGGQGEGNPQDLFTLIAVRRIDLLRIVVLQLLPHGETPDPALLGVGLRVAGLVKGLLPRDVTVAHGSGTSLVRANLLVPETGASDVSQELVAAGWEVNALASPEDRPDLDQASIFVRTDINYHAHAVAAVACVGGLWPGVRQGAFDDVQVDSTSGETDLVVFRPSARVLLGDELPGQVAEAAIALAQDTSGDGASALVPWAAVAQTPDEVVATSHDELVAQGEWARDELRELDGVPKSEMSIGAAFGDLARFEGRLILAAGRVIGNKATRWVENRATQVTAGSEGRYVVRVEPRTPDQILVDAQERLDEQTANLKSRQLEREAVKVQPPVPGTWVELRQLCFALADGSPLPTGFTTPERASMREILPPSRIVPHPEDTFTAGDGTVVRSVDTAAAARLQAGMDRGDDTASGQPESEGTSGEPAESETGGESTKLEDWVERRANTLMWRLANTVWRREHEAGEKADAAYRRAIDAATPDAKAVRRSRKRLLVCWALIGLGLLGAGVWASVLHWMTASLTWPGFGRGLGVLLVVCTVLALYGGWQYYRALSHFERQLQRLLAERRHAGEVFVVASREARRLGLLYEGVRDWAQVIGWVLHEPWATEASVDHELELDMDDLPASVAIAVHARDAGHVPTALKHDAISILCNRGWIRQIFDDVVAASQDRRGHRGSHMGHLPADLDAGVTNHGARRQLMDAVASRDLRVRLAGLARARVAAGIADGVLELPVREVVRLGDYASIEPISDEQFFHGALGPATPFVEQLWTDQGMQDRCNLVARSVAWIPASRAADDGGAVETRRSVGDSSVRVDISRPCTPAQIRLFGPRVRAVRPIVVASEGWV